jgi:hypothetical protein
MNINKKVTTGVVAIVGIAALAAVPFIAYAAPTATSRLTQQITAGALSTDIRDGSGNVLANPAFTMSAATVSNEQQTVTGTFGSETQRITVDNPGGASGGWTLALNATTPGTGTWTSGANNYPYNGTAAAGRLTVNPAAGAIVSTIGASTGISLGASTSFTGTTPVTLVTATEASDDIWNGYFTGIGLTQTIPASTPAGSYTLDMTQTVTAS